MWESSQWLWKNIVLSTSNSNHRKSWIGAVVVKLICLPVTTTWADPTMTELHLHNNFHTVIPTINDDDDDEMF